MTALITFSVEVALLTVVDGALAVLLRQREDEPFGGRWALPGGPVLPGEDLDEQAPARLLRDAGVSAPPGSLEQLRTYGAPDRDPRGRAVSTAYLGLLPGPDGTVPEGTGVDRGTAGGRWWPVRDVRDDDLAFDHAAILADAVERTRAKLEYSALATCFVAEPFTIGELRAVYEAVWDTALDPAEFRRGVLSVEGFVEPVEQAAGDDDAAGAAQRYRRGPAALLHPAMLRPALPRPDGA